ncbi:hypothetical protein BJ912DRAFT_1062734 [Pholiota molesta]|nr:hypothetical protein BJ912DRAFT_1062734 [Pholiota molesta]
MEEPAQASPSVACSERETDLLVTPHGSEASAASSSLSSALWGPQHRSPAAQPHAWEAPSIAAESALAVVAASVFRRYPFLDAQYGNLLYRLLEQKSATDHFAREFAPLATGKPGPYNGKEGENGPAAPTDDMAAQDEDAGCKGESALTESARRAHRWTIYRAIIGVRLFGQQEIPSPVSGRE